MRNRSHVSFWAATLLFACLVSFAHGNVIVFSTSPDATVTGLPVSATATFTLEADRVTIQLENLQADPRSVAQALSGLHFVLSGGQTSGSVLAGQGMWREVAWGGDYTDLGVGSAGWALRWWDGQFHLGVLDTPTAPAHLILGPPDEDGTYDAANRSIAGNRPHNPFLGTSALFVLDVPGVTAGSTITAVAFSFGTSHGYDVPGEPPGTGAPEPAALTLLAAGGCLLAKRRLRRRAA